MEKVESELKRYVALCSSLREGAAEIYQDCWEGDPRDPKSYRTAVWAEDLDDAIQKFKDRNHDVKSIVEDTEHRCPRCGGLLWRRTNYLGQRFFCCSNYKLNGCKYTESI